MTRCVSANIDVPEGQEMILPNLTNLFHLNRLFTLWKLGFIGWLELNRWSVKLFDAKGTRGFFTGTEAFSAKLFTVRTGEVAFVCFCLGASNLSRILYVFSSNGLLSGDEETEFLTVGLEMHVGE